jgi:hypothetical protein
MRLFTTKKAQEITTSKAFYWLVGLLVAVALAYTLWGFGANFVATLTQTPEIVSQDLLIARLLNTCFSYEEQITPTQTKIRPSVLDMSKITNDRIAECFVGEAILPSVVVDVMPTKINPQAFSPQRAILTETHAQESLVAAMTRKTKQAEQTRYVLLQEINTLEVCGLCDYALVEANKQNDNLFYVPVLLTPEDFTAIESYIAELQRITDQILLRGYSTDQDIFPTLQLTASSEKYNAKPRLDDICYSKTTGCTYQDFLRDYKGDCQKQRVVGTLFPAVLTVNFYE